jgi:cell fate (sporulation/competence/biofilm development) regulator YlbF (YheA/YmcA/DUF963 family)
VDKEDMSNQPAIIKAKELALAIKESDAFKRKNAEEMQAIILECNDIIKKTIKIDYGGVCKPKSGCCG